MSIKQPKNNIMDGKCQCSHCDCGDDEKKENKSPEEKVNDLKKAIEGLGYKVEDKGEGEIKISQ